MNSDLLNLNLVSLRYTRLLSWVRAGLGGGAHHFLPPLRPHPILPAFSYLPPLSQTGYPQQPLSVDHFAGSSGFLLPHRVLSSWD